MAWRPFRTHDRVPLACHNLEGIGCGLLHFTSALLFPQRWINAILQKPTRLTRVLTRLGKRHCGIDTQGEPLLLASEAILQTPISGAARGDLDVETLPIAKLVGLRTRLRHANRGVGERHGGISLSISKLCPQICPQLGAWQCLRV